MTDPLMMQEHTRKDETMINVQRLLCIKLPENDLYWIEVYSSNISLFITEGQHYESCSKGAFL
jgi:hypothetical protein